MYMMVFFDAFYKTRHKLSNYHTILYHYQFSKPTIHMIHKLGYVLVSYTYFSFYNYFVDVQSIYQVFFLLYFLMYMMVLFDAFYKTRHKLSNYHTILYHYQFSKPTIHMIHKLGYVLVSYTYFSFYNFFVDVQSISQVFFLLYFLT